MPRPTSLVMRFVGWFLYYLSYVTVQFLARVYWRGSIKGFENVPKSGAYLICPVHRSNADGPLAVILTRRRIRYMAKDSMFEKRWLGATFRAMGSFPIHRGTPDRESLKLSLEVLEKGEPLVLFPEGTRKVGAAVTDVHEGAVYLAMKANVPILPIGIGNSDVACPRKKIIMRPAKIAMVVGEPIHYPHTEKGRVPRVAITEQTAVLQDRLQELYDEAMALTPAAERHLSERAQ